MLIFMTPNETFVVWELCDIIHDVKNERHESTLKLNAILFQWEILKEGVCVCVHFQCITPFYDLS